MLKAYVQSQVIVPGFHWWPNAPEAVRYLRNPHRHLFYIRATAPVSHDDHDIDFHLLKGQVEVVLRESYELGQFGPGTEGIFNFATASCEAIAETLLNKLPMLAQVSVFEDDENGAILAREAEPEEPDRMLGFDEAEA